MSYPSCLAMLLFIFNLISLVFGIFVIWVGVYKYSFKSYLTINTIKFEMMDSDKDDLFIFRTETIVIGTIICLVSIFGLISAATKNTFCLKLYAAINVMILGGLIITSLIGFSRFKGAAEKLMEKFIAINFNSNKYKERKILIDDIQSRLNCCGKTGIENYAQAKILPSTCCLDGHCSPKNIYDGCNTKILELVNMYRMKIFDVEKKLFIVISVIAGVIKLLGSMLALSIVDFNKSKILREKIESSYAGKSGRIW